MVYNPAATIRRIDVLIRILGHRKGILAANNVRAYSSDEKVTIGDVTKEIKAPEKVEYVPRKYCKSLNLKVGISNLCFSLISYLIILILISIVPRTCRK